VTGSGSDVTPAPPWHATFRARLLWRWSERDEHRVGFLMAGVAVAIGLVLRVLPRDVDVVHTFEHGLGFMAPTCGLTRGGLALLRGDLATAWSYNPAIFLVALLAAALGARFATGVATGRWLTLRVNAGFVGRLVGLALITVLWLNQQAHFAFLAR
jgi:Protein of unknown function (DUF2752)